MPIHNQAPDIPLCILDVQPVHKRQRVVRPVEKANIYPLFPDPQRRRTSGIPIARHLSHHSAFLIIFQVQQFPVYNLGVTRMTWLESANCSSWNGKTIPRQTHIASCYKYSKCPPSNPACVLLIPSRRSQVLHSLRRTVPGQRATGDGSVHSPCDTIY